MAPLIREWVVSCKQCITKTQINRRLTCLPLQNPSKHVTVPEDAMQIEFDPEKPRSCGYENTLEVMDVFSIRFLPTPHLIKPHKQLQKSY